MPPQGSTRELDAKSKTRDLAGKVRVEAVNRAYAAYKEAKKQADIVHKAASKLAVDKQARTETDKALKEAVRLAERVRDAIIKEAMTVFTAAWDLSEKDYQEATASLKMHIDRAEKTFQDAKKQADLVYKGALQMAVDSQAREHAAKVRKETVRRAETARDEALARSLQRQILKQ